MSEGITISMDDSDGTLDGLCRRLRLAKIIGATECRFVLTPDAADALAQVIERPTHWVIVDPHQQRVYTMQLWCIGFMAAASAHEVLTIIARTVIALTP